MPRDPDRILEDVEAYMHAVRRTQINVNGWTFSAALKLQEEISELRNDMHIAKMLDERHDWHANQEGLRQCKRCHEILGIGQMESPDKPCPGVPFKERMPRLYLLEADERAVYKHLAEADLCVQFTDNIGEYGGAMRTEGKLHKNRWGPGGMIEIVENPAR